MIAPIVTRLHLVAAGAEDRPVVVVAEQAVGGALHVQQVLGVGADAAEDAEDRLHEQRRLDQPALEEVGEVVEVADVVALELEARAVVSPSSLRMYSMSLKVLRKMKSRDALEIRRLPVVLELLDAFDASGRGRSSSSPC